MLLITPLMRNGHERIKIVPDFQLLQIGWFLHHRQVTSFRHGVRQFCLVIVHEQRIDDNHHSLFQPQTLHDRASTRVTDNQISLLHVFLQRTLETISLTFQWSSSILWNDGFVSLSILNNQICVAIRLHPVQRGWLRDHLNQEVKSRRSYGYEYRSFSHLRFQLLVTIENFLQWRTQ